MRKIFFIILLYFLVHHPLLAQPKQGKELIDSLLTVLESIKAKDDTVKVKLLLTLGMASINNSEFEKSIEYCKQALSLSETLDFKNGKSNAYNTMGWAYNNLGNYPEALKNNFAALTIREETGNKKGIAGSTHNIGNIYAVQGNYTAALSMYFKALKINEEIGNKEWIGGEYNQIGIVYMSQKQYPEALKYLQKSLKIYEESGDRPSQNHPYNNMGNVYFESGNYTEALKNYQVALQIRQEMGDLYEVGNSLSNVGICYEVMGNYPEALKNYFACLRIANEIDNKDGKATVCVNIGNINVKMKKFAEAKRYYDTAHALAKETGSLDGIKAYHDGMAGLDSATGNYQSALQHYKLFVQYRDSLVNDENKKQLVQQQMQYDFDKKESLTKAVQEKEVQKQKLLRNGFIGGTILFLLLAGAIFIGLRKTGKAKKQSDELLLNILPGEVAEELKKTGNAKAKSFTMVTVMFTDFKDFTKVSEKVSAELLVAEIHTCFSAFDHILQNYKIEKIKTIGDAYLCASGLPVSNYTHATDMIRAAFEIRNYMLQRKKEKEARGEIPFELRIGIHTGPVVAGIVGIKKYAYDIWGDTVNIAARMEQNSEAGKVNISGSTYDLVKDKFSCTPRGKITAKNKGEVDMYFVESVS